MNNPNTNQNINPNNQPQIPQFGGNPTIFTPLMNGIGYINHHIMY